MKHTKRAFGDQAETLVAQELCKKGFTICERNYQKLYGEIDIIARKDDLLVFVEVKVRQYEYGSMHDLVPNSKQKKICLVAREYISRNRVMDKICRFDIALIEMNNDQPVLTYIPHAFMIDEY